MGEHEVRKQADPEELRIFMRKLLADLRALEQMLAEGRIESGVQRIGAEQELFLVNGRQRPARTALEVLEAIDDPHFTTELGRFNLEFNLDPIDLGPGCLRELEARLDHLLGLARKGAQTAGTTVVLTGILPTLDKSDLSWDNMTPVPRYYALAEAMYRLRGAEFEFHIKGRDELTVRHDSVMAEACNTSFQVHFQVDPASFAALYNIAQAVAGPTLAAATNSPVLFGHRLWHETRIALFSQSIDTRHGQSHRRQQRGRVSFGEHWIDDSVIEIFREDVARYRLLMSTTETEDPFTALEAGRAPTLKALRLHNSTVYRWNRPCYGILDGKPHLRIENRILPSGPSIRDEVANSAFWFGMIKGIRQELGDVRRHLRFDQVHENFIAAARLGLKAELHWLEGRTVPAQELICSELLPLARTGLEALRIDPESAATYLGVVEERVRRRQTGSQWILDSLAGMGDQGSPIERAASLVAATVSYQERGDPVHTWPMARLRESADWGTHYRKVASLMTTDLFTVNEDDVIDLVASLMDWKHIRHVPVENNQHRLVGLVTHRALLRFMARELRGGDCRPVPVKDIMERDLVTVTPTTLSLEAIRLMKEHKIACLPVVENGQLVGILTERDFMRIADHLLQDFLTD